MFPIQCTKLQILCRTGNLSTILNYGEVKMLVPFKVVSSFWKGTVSKHGCFPKLCEVDLGVRYIRSCTRRPGPKTRVFSSHRLSNNYHT